MSRATLELRKRASWAALRTAPPGVNTLGAVVAARDVGHQSDERDDTADELEDVEVYREAGVADELRRSEVELAGGGQESREPSPNGPPGSRGGLSRGDADREALGHADVAAELNSCGLSTCIRD
jgi:hypothetical protein